MRRSCAPHTAGSCSCPAAAPPDARASGSPSRDRLVNLERAGALRPYGHVDWTLIRPRGPLAQLRARAVDGLPNREPTLVEISGMLGDRRCDVVVRVDRVSVPVPASAVQSPSEA